MRRSAYSVLVVGLAAIVVLASSWIAVSGERKGWLTDAPDDATRWARMEKYVGGFSTAMAVVGDRFVSVQGALKDENWQLARYHWRYLKRATEQGILRRPKRAANTNAMFLETAWPEFDAALQTADKAVILSAYEDAAAACQSCHVAENVDFMNDQPMFRVELK
ncbi:MAG: hypothetical protein AAFV45_04845 [Pseudomonadota bacterium]